MALVVQKYGGTSLATPKHIQQAAHRIAELKKTGTQVVVVVSAMGHTTDHLIKLASKTVKSPPSRELDMLLTAGERVSMSLLAMSLQERDIPAISFTGSQSGIITTENHTQAKILEIKPARIQDELAKEKVVIIAGFQGVSRNKEITTLGRGGSDTTAVALAAVLKADRCEILTDVRGIYSADPRLVPEAKLFSYLSYDKCLQLSVLGAKMHPRSIELAKRFNVPVLIGLSHSKENKGTDVGTNKVE
jgi:aspartate kinase